LHTRSVAAAGCRKDGRGWSDVAADDDDDVDDDDDDDDDDAVVRSGSSRCDRHSPNTAALPAGSPRQSSPGATR